MRVLFVVKQREYGAGYSGVGKGGLLTSAKLVADMLNAQRIAVARVASVVDNNDIDREVSRFKADLVVIEALWVVPSKFHELARLHPTVRWVVRIHSEIPFLANEGIAVDWMQRCQLIHNVQVAANEKSLVSDLKRFLLNPQKVLLLPNYYPLTNRATVRQSDVFNVGCFGAIRPLKNQLAQAVAAKSYADDRGLPFRFHVNNRVEQGGDSVLKNLRALLGSRLVVHPWLEHSEFLQLMARMSLSMSVSFTETFNIVSADAVGCGIPIVVSPQVRWAGAHSKADPTNISDMIAKIGWARTAGRAGTYLNTLGLKSYDAASVAAWRAALR